MNSDFLAAAKIARNKRLTELRKRDRLAPCLADYDSTLAKLVKAGTKSPEQVVMGELTATLLGTEKTVREQIRLAGKEGINAINAIKRSAGTNYQGLCEYAVLRWLETTDLPVRVGPNAPKSMKDELTIYGVDADGGEFSVEPDIDICLWIENNDPCSPIIFLSAKTSLVDRAGQAARWKLYLDMHQTTCRHIKDVADCPINRTRIKIKTQHKITHSIVTANIYKMNTTQPDGELRSGQCRNNTYMFRHKFTTRTDDFKPSSWKGFSDFPDLVRFVFDPYVAALSSKAPRREPTVEPDSGGEKPTQSETAVLIQEEGSQTSAL